MVMQEIVNLPPSGTLGSIPRYSTKFQGDATVVTARAGEDKKPKYADELA
jgi:hypothetical protein